MDKLNPWKTILTGMALVLIGCFLFISHAAPTLARLLMGVGVLVELFSVIVFLFGELRRYLRRLDAKTAHLTTLLALLMIYPYCLG